jgi:hypothetical protein
MPTLTEQFNELAALMEEGLPLERELEAKVGKLISDYETARKAGKFDSDEMVPSPSGGTMSASWKAALEIYEPFEKWVDANFRVNLTNTPRGGKPVKAAWKRFTYYINAMQGSRSSTANMSKAWDDFKPMVPKLVKLFTDQGKQVTRDIKTANATYINQKGVSSATFKKYVKALDAMFSALKGWRRKALGKGLKVVLAGSDSFRGTAKGRYNKPSDTLFVRATPKVMKRSGGAYGSPEYILIHELGHRYENMHHHGTKFDGTEWTTTPYSMTDSMTGTEKFAELFALGHFGIRNAHREFGSVVDRFEQEMK